CGTSRCRREGRGLHPDGLFHGPTWTDREEGHGTSSSRQEEEVARVRTLHLHALGDVLGRREDAEGDTMIPHGPCEKCGCWSSTAVCQRCQAELKIRALE